VNVEQFNKILPYLFLDEIAYLQKLGSTLKPDDTVVMLGVGPAMMTLALCGSAPESLKFVGFDINQSTIWFAEKHVEELKQDIIFTREDSAKAAGLFEDETVDLLLIDADHSYEAVKKDIKAWWNKIKVGGLVLFHDYVKINPEDDNGVAEAIRDCQDETWEEISRPGISIVFRKG